MLVCVRAYVCVCVCLCVFVRDHIDIEFRPSTPDAGAHTSTPNAGTHTSTPNAGGPPSTRNAGFHPSTPNTSVHPSAPNAGVHPCRQMAFVWIRRAGDTGTPDTTDTTRLLSARSRTKIVIKFLFGPFGARRGPGPIPPFRSDRELSSLIFIGRGPKSDGKTFVSWGRKRKFYGVLAGLISTWTP